MNDGLNVAYAQYGPRDPFDKCADEHRRWEAQEAGYALMALRDMARRTPDPWAQGVADDIDAFFAGKPAAQHKAKQEAK